VIYKKGNNWTYVDRLAYKLYEDYMIKLDGVEEYAADWWFKNHKDEPQYKKFYKIAERKIKINKIIKNGKKYISP